MARYLVTRALAFALAAPLFAQLEPDSEPVSLGPLGGQATSVVADPQDPDVLLLIQDSPPIVQGLFRSTDGGATFEPYGTGLPDYIVALTPVPGDDDLLYVIDMAGNRIMKSTDFGATWNPTTPLPDPNDAAPKGIAPAPSGGALLAYDAFSVYRSLDGGTTWSVSLSVVPFAGTVLDAVAYSQSDASVAYVGALGAGLYRSTDGGASFVDRRPGGVAPCGDPTPRNRCSCPLLATSVDQRQLWGALWRAQRGAARREDAFVVGRHHLHEVRHHQVPVVEDPTAQLAVGMADVGLDHSVHQPDLALVSQRLELDHLHVAVAPEGVLAIEHVGDAAAHPRGEVAPGLAQHHHDPAGHVLAAVVTDALDDCARTAVTHREALAGDAVDVDLSGCGAVENGVADDDVVLGDQPRSALGVHRDAAPRQSLAEVVVGVSRQLQSHPRHQKGAESSGRRSR